MGDFVLVAIVYYDNHLRKNDAGVLLTETTYFFKPIKQFSALAITK
jgi:hypothetical protein